MGELLPLRSILLLGQRHGDRLERLNDVVAMVAVVRVGAVQVVTVLGQGAGDDLEDLREIDLLAGHALLTPLALLSGDGTGRKSPAPCPQPDDIS